MWFVELQACLFEQFERFLKGPYSWRKPDFGEKSYLWLAFFSLWNRRTKISSVEYLWFCLFFVRFTKFRKPYPFFFYYWHSTCASFWRNISNLFVCWLLSKLFPIITVIFRYFLIMLMAAKWFGPHTCCYCNWHLVMMTNKIVKCFVHYEWHEHSCAQLLFVWFRKM